MLMIVLFVVFYMTEYRCVLCFSDVLICVVAVINIPPTPTLLVLLLAQASSIMRIIQRHASLRTTTAAFSATNWVGEC